MMVCRRCVSSGYDAAIFQFYVKLDAFIILHFLPWIYLALRTCGRAFFAVKDISTRNFLLAIAHHCQFYLVLDILDMEGATIGLTASQGPNHQVGQLFDGFMNPGRSCSLPAFDRQESLGHCDGNLVLVKTG